MFFQDILRGNKSSAYRPNWLVSKYYIIKIYFSRYRSIICFFKTAKDWFFFFWLKVSPMQKIIFNFVLSAFSILFLIIKKLSPEDLDSE